MKHSAEDIGQPFDHIAPTPEPPSWTLDRADADNEQLTRYLQIFCERKHLRSCPETEGTSNVTPQCGSLGACGVPILTLLDQLSFRLNNGSRFGKRAYFLEAQEEYDTVLKLLEDLTEIAREKFYAFPFADVPACWRDLFREASFMKVAALAIRRGPGKVIDTVFWEEAHEISVKLTEPVLSEMVRTIDTALIMAGPPTEISTKDAVNRILDLLQKSYSDFYEAHDGESASHRLKRLKIAKVPAEIGHDYFPATSTFNPPITCPISKLAGSVLPFERFEAHMQQPQNTDLGPEPIVIGGSIEIWPARNERPWRSPSYLLSKTIGGRRLVPIEIGRSYVDEGFGQKIVTFKEFLDQYILGDPQIPELPSGYLAQHNLFAQIPALRNDISIPDYCFTDPPLPHHSSPLAARHAQMSRLEDPLLNAWFGPAGTISPLHTDPYHNILAQVVGKKYVRLYAPRESKKLYARGVEEGGVNMENTSALDIGVLAGWDGTKEEQAQAHRIFPLFREAEFVECILLEGECLYIPLGWWHYVRSLSVSFSVSFWFN